MPPDDWVTRHPELVHWLQHAEDEFVGYAPLDDIPCPLRSSRSGCSRFLSSSAPRWGRMGCRATNGPPWIVS